MRFYQMKRRGKTMISTVMRKVTEGLVVDILGTMRASLVAVPRLPWQNIEEVTMQSFNKEIADQGIAWILLFYTQQAKGQFVLESVLEDVARSLDGAVRVS
jgi:hypothetical protein